MHIPNIEDFDITHLSYPAKRRLLPRYPDSTFYVVPTSAPASTLQHLEKYDFKRMPFLQALRLSIRWKGTRRYPVPREHASGDTPPSYSSVTESDLAGSSPQAGNMSQGFQVSSPAGSFTACHAPVRSHPSSRHKQTSELRFHTFDTDLEDLVHTFVRRASMVRLFFSGARGTSALADSTVAADLERLGASLDTLRSKFQLFTSGECGPSRSELLDYGESLIASLERWKDKVKPLFDDFRVVMFGDEQGNFVQVTDADYEAWAQEAREMGRWTPILINRVETLRTILQQSLPPFQSTSPAVDLDTNSSEERAAVRDSKGSLRKTARIARLERDQQEQVQQQLDDRAAYCSTATTFCWVPGVSCS